jgi:hypothetical protein
MKPTIGRVVIYNTTEEQRATLSEKGNTPKQLPAIVTAVWNESQVNLQVITDGMHGTYWVTTVDQGDGERQWNWPVIER